MSEMLYFYGVNLACIIAHNISINKKHMGLPTCFPSSQILVHYFVFFFREDGFEIVIAFVNNFLDILFTSLYFVF